jgi:hypothetical protein
MGPGSSFKPRLQRLLLSALLVVAAPASAVDAARESTPANAPAPSDTERADSGAVDNAETARGTTAPGAAGESLSADPATASSASGFGDSLDVAVEAALTREGLSKRVTALPLAQGKSIALLLPPPEGRQARGGLLIVPAPRAVLADPLTLTLARTAAAGDWLTLALQPRPDTARAAIRAPAAVAAENTTSTAPQKEAGATPALCAQLTAAIETLVERGVTEVIVVAVGNHVTRTLACAPALPQPVVALVAMGRWLGTLDALDVPVLELPPAQDGHALRYAEARAETARDKPRGAYRLMPVDASDERYQGGELDVAKRVRGWLAQLPRKPTA